MRASLFVASLYLCLICSVTAETITFETGGQSFDIEFVEIGSPGNPADFDERYPGEEKSLGAVDYVYGIAKYEATCEGFNAYIAPGAVCQNRDDYPLNTSDEGIIGYVNWLNELKGYPDAYDVEIDEFGHVVPNLIRNPAARFFITSADEWHKAAYYDPIAEVYYDYATGSDSRPMSVAEGTAPGTAVLQSFTGTAQARLAGGLSPFGTVGQTGNMHELEENLRWYRWGNNSFGSAQAHLARVEANSLTGGVGFRLVSVPPVPEPAGSLMAVCGCVSVLAVLRSSLSDGVPLGGIRFDSNLQA